MLTKELMFVHKIRDLCIRQPGWATSSGQIPAGTSPPCIQIGLDAGAMTLAIADSVDCIKKVIVDRSGRIMVK